MFERDCREHRPVERVELLVAAPTCAGVENRVGRVAVKIRIARVDGTEIGQQRDEPTVFLVDAIADFVNLRNLAPRKNVADVCRLYERFVHFTHHYKNA